MLCSDSSTKAACLRAGLVLLLACVAINSGAALVTEFPIPIAGTQPEAITRGPDGAYWFAGFNGNYIGRITPGGSVTSFNILKPGSLPFGIAVGPDNNLWFTEFNGNKIGCVNTNGVLIGEFTIPTPSSRPAGIARGPDDRLWFAERDASKIGAIATNAFTPGATGFFTEYTTINGITTNSYPFNIVSGPDGNLWFTENGIGQIGRISTTGFVHEFKLAANCQPFDIIQGADGALWFTEYVGNKIGRISPTGATNEYTLPFPGSAPYGLTLGKDGNIWFAEYLGGRMGRLATNGTNVTITEFAIPSAVTLTPYPTFLTSGLDGTIWFTELAGNNIGRISDNLLTVTFTNLYPTTGLTFSGTVAGFRDSDPVTGTISQYSATIDWGDGTTNAGTIVTNTSGGFKVNGTHTYAPGSGYQLIVTITDNDTTHDMGGAMATGAFSINLPALKIQSATPDEAVISWITNFAGLKLQSNTNLSTTNWVAVTNIPAVVGNKFIVTNTVPGNSFYRLKQ